MKALPLAVSSAAVALALLLADAPIARADDMGFLDVASDPPDAKILIDDGDVGQTTPQHHLPVRAGHHRLTLVTKDGAHKRSLGFTIDAGQTKKLTLVFAK